MTTPLLQTKLFIPPLRQELVSRPRLVDRLNAGLRGELTLVSAPAGFGKTTLLSEWVRQHEEVASSAASPLARHFAWISLDVGDNDPVRFWRYVVAALRGVSLVERRR
jgi:LuxR family maltose regulon positive regulatory protein